MDRNIFWRCFLVLVLILSASFLFAEISNIDHDIVSLEDFFLTAQEVDLIEDDEKSDESDRDKDLSISSEYKKLNIVTNASMETTDSAIKIEDLIDVVSETVQPTDVQRNMLIMRNQYVDGFIKYLSTQRINFIKQSLKRGEPYIKEMKEIFRENGIPEDLVYLPIIESGFKNHALSNAKAVGMWQFIPDTARWIGMNVNTWIDERRDPIVSCRYAAKYLKYLYDVFEDWYLVLASYNHGGFNIKRELKRVNSIEYYDLVRYRATPAETRAYVPSLIAVLYIIKNHEEFGIDLVEQDQDHSYVNVPFMVPSSVVAQHSGITLAEFNHLNPALRQGFTPESKYNYMVRLPKKNADILSSNIHKLKKSAYASYVPYYVKSGDSLSVIANKFGVSISILMKINNITNVNFIKINQRLFIPIGKRS